MERVDAEAKQGRKPSRGRSTFGILIEGRPGLSPARSAGRGAGRLVESAIKVEPTVSQLHPSLVVGCDYVYLLYFPEDLSLAICSLSLWRLWGRYTTRF